MYSRKFMWLGSSAILLLMVVCITKNFYQLNPKNSTQKVQKVTESSSIDTQPIISTNSTAVINSVNDDDTDLTQQLMDKLLKQRELESQTKTTISQTDKNHTIYPIDKTNKHSNNTEVSTIDNNQIINSSNYIKTIQKDKQPSAQKQTIQPKKKIKKQKRIAHKYKKFTIHRIKPIQIDKVISNETINFSKNRRLSKVAKLKLHRLIKKMKHNKNSTIQLYLTNNNLKELKTVGMYLVNHSIPRSSIKVVNQRSKKRIIITDSDQHKEVELSLVEQRN